MKGQATYYISDGSCSRFIGSRPVAWRRAMGVLASAAAKTLAAVIVGITGVALVALF